MEKCYIMLDGGYYFTGFGRNPQGDIITLKSSCHFKHVVLLSFDEAQKKLLIINCKFGHSGEIVKCFLCREQVTPFTRFDILDLD